MLMLALSDISHELRTPLTLILGPAAELRDTSLSKTQQAQVTMIDRNAKRLLRLVRFPHLSLFLT